MKHFKVFFLVVAFLMSVSCNNTTTSIQVEKKASEILGNPAYLAFSYGGYRATSREIQPTIEELKEDLMLLKVMGVGLIRTYNTSQYAHAENILKAIREIQTEDPSFEMYVMLGAWIDCINAWTDKPVDHTIEDEENNSTEIEKAISLANEYPGIVKIIAVGNEAMVHWAASYFVTPTIILKWVNYLQQKKSEGKLPSTIWITSSDNFASWGGGDTSYHTSDLNALIKAVDFISMHTYPYHDTHYNPTTFWNPVPKDSINDVLAHSDLLMDNAVNYAKQQYENVYNYMISIGENKPIHIGETGWASVSGGFYGPEGSKASDEYKMARYYQGMRDWTATKNMSCFYFEAFDEQWKDAQHPLGSENHFGLFTVDGKAKYPIWHLVDEGVFDGLTRGGNTITKTYDGNEEILLNEVLLPSE